MLVRSGRKAEAERFWHDRRTHSAEMPGEISTTCRVLSAYHKKRIYCRIQPTKPGIGI